MMEIFSVLVVWHNLDLHSSLMRCWLETNQGMIEPLWRSKYHPVVLEIVPNSLDNHSVFLFGLNQNIMSAAKNGTSRISELKTNTRHQETVPLGKMPELPGFYYSQREMRGVRSSQHDSNLWLMLISGPRPIPFFFFITSVHFPRVSATFSTRIFIQECGQMCVCVFENA